MNALPKLTFFWLILFAVGFPAAHGAEHDWQEGYVIAEGSASPDGCYGVLLPSRLVADALDDDAITNALVDLKSRRRLATIRGAHYFPGQNHNGLRVAWAENSEWCVVTYEGRYGFQSITVVEMKGGKCGQTEIGKTIQKALNAVIAKQARNPADGGPGGAYFRLLPDRTLLIRAIASTNPKGFDDQPTYCALFLGTLDLTSGKWIRSDARKVAGTDALEFAFAEHLDEDITFSEEAHRLNWHDERLNETYQAVRSVLPAARFAEVKKEQLAWLKRLEATKGTGKKCELMAARIRELRQLVW